MTRLRRRGTPAPAWTLRLTAAATAGYVVAWWAFPDSAAPPLLAPLTALLVVQITPVSLLVSGLDRVLSVVVGVSLAVLFSEAVGLTWWSLALLIAASLVLGQVLRLGPNLLEVPISAMLVLGVGALGAQSAASQRIAETLVGAAVAVLANLVLPPRLVAVDAGEAIRGFAEDVADLLEQAGGGFERAEDAGRLAEQADDWLGRARRLTHGIPAVGAALLQAEESRRLNVRALGTPDAGPGLRHGLEALEHSAVAVRSLFGTLDVTARRWAEEGRDVDPQLRAAVAVLLHELAGGVRGFGRLVRAEAAGPRALPDRGRAPERERAPELEGAPGATASPDHEQTVAFLEELREARARVAELLLADMGDDPALGQLVVVLGGTVERLIREFDLDERLRRSRAAEAARRPASLSHLVRIRRPHR